MHFNQVRLLVLRQPKVQPHVISGKKVSPTPDSIVLHQIPGNYLHQCADSIPVTLHAHAL
jgi:hypothetical protein